MCHGVHNTTISLGWFLNPKPLAIMVMMSPNAITALGLKTCSSRRWAMKELMVTTFPFNQLTV